MESINEANWPRKVGYKYIMDALNLWGLPSPIPHYLTDQPTHWFVDKSPCGQFEGRNTLVNDG